jgi:hypothetical protein
LGQPGEKRGGFFGVSPPPPPPSLFGYPRFSYQRGVLQVIENHETYETHRICSSIVIWVCDLLKDSNPNSYGM